MSIIQYAIQAFNLVKSAIEAGKAVKDVYDIINRTNDSLAAMEAENRGPNQTEWDTLNAETAALNAGAEAAEAAREDEE